MASKNIFLLLLILTAQLAFCQNEKWIHGKIIVKDATPKGVHIINLVNEKETVSNDKGEFDIQAKTDDLLVFSSNHLDYQRKIIEEEDYQSAKVIIQMTSKTTQLDEVTITKQPQFDAVKLGILSKPAKKYTLAERHLRTARSSSLDQMLNAFSGRTKMLENELLIEREEAALSTLNDLFENDYYTKELKIEPDHVRGFQLYAIQNRNLNSALSSKNKALVSFILLQLSIDYNILQQSDKTLKTRSIPMASKNIFLILILLIGQFAFSQNEKLIHGRIIVKDVSPQGVHIINLVNEKETLSDEKGEFSIEAKTDDLLVFSPNHLDYQRKIIEDDDYKSGSVNIEMTAKITQLDEVKIIKHPEMDGFQAGILSKPAKKYTPAERHLKTAGIFKPIQLLGLLGGQVPIDPILNAISGRTTMLKKELLVEREESLLSVLTTLFKNDYYTKELKIEPDHIKGFQQYAVQDKNMRKALRSKNKAIISFVAVQLAFEYNNLQRTNKP